MPTLGSSGTSAGGIGSNTYVFLQMSPESLWDIVHNLYCYPSVTVIDSNGNVCYGDITYLSDRRLQIRFSAPFSGHAFLNY